MSARTAISGPGFPPLSRATTPVLAMPVRASSPSARRWAATSSAVWLSRLESSGFWWMRWRSSMSWGATFSRLPVDPGVESGIGAGRRGGSGGREEAAASPRPGAPPGRKPAPAAPGEPISCEGACIPPKRNRAVTRPSPVRGAHAIRVSLYPEGGFPRHRGPPACQAPAQEVRECYPLPPRAGETWRHLHRIHIRRTPSLFCQETGRKTVGELALNIENRKILVLGGYGLVGTAVCRELLRAVRARSRSTACGSRSPRRRSRS